MGALEVLEVILEGADIVKQLRRQQLRMLPPNWKTRGVGESVIAIRRRDKPRQQEKLTVSIEKPLADASARSSGRFVISQKISL